jgi:hypothetical protein
METFASLIRLYTRKMQVLLATQSQALYLEFVSFLDDLLFSSKINVGGSDIFQRLMISLVVVVLSPLSDCSFQLRQRVVIL